MIENKRINMVRSLRIELIGVATFLVLQIARFLLAYSIVGSKYPEYSGWGAYSTMFYSHLAVVITVVLVICCGAHLRVLRISVIIVAWMVYVSFVPQGMSRIMLSAMENKVDDLDLVSLQSRCVELIEQETADRFHGSRRIESDSFGGKMISNWLPAGVPRDARALIHPTEIDKSFCLFRWRTFFLGYGIEIGTEQYTLESFSAPCGGVTIVRPISDGVVLFVQTMW